MRTDTVTGTAPTAAIHGTGTGITAHITVHTTVHTGVRAGTIGDTTVSTTRGTMEAITTRGITEDIGDGMTHGITTIITDGITRTTTALHTSPGRRMAGTDITVCAHIPKSPLPAQDAQSHRQAVQSEAPAEPHEEA